jgi:type II secretory pathway component GspD/PulD (secretin)
MAPRNRFGLAACLLLSAGAAFGQSQTAGDLTTTAYSVADLVFPVAANRDGGKLATTEAELMARIVKQVAPATWDRAGGPGAMRFEANGHLLHVRQTPAVHAELKAFLQKLKRGQVSLEVRILTVSEAFLERMGVQWSENDGVRYFSLSDVQLFQLLEAAQGDQGTHIVQLPKTTLFDGQDANVDSIEWLTFRTGADLQTKGTQTLVVPKDEKFFSGIKSRFLPTISADRTHVTVQAEMSIRSFFRNTPVAPISIALPEGIDETGKPIVNPVKFEMMVQKPTFTELKVAVAAKIPDQRTIALRSGTILQEKRTESAVPVLSRVPYVNRMFRTTAYGRDAATVVFLVTPRILAESELETVRVERLRNGIQAEDDGLFPILPRAGR